MAFIRFTLDLAVKQPIPQALQDALPGIKTKIQQLKSYASKINEGKSNEEMTVKATWHICHHDEGGGCGDSTEI